MHHASKTHEIYATPDSVRLYPERMTSRSGGFRVKIATVNGKTRLTARSDHKRPKGGAGFFELGN